MYDFISDHIERSFFFLSKSNNNKQKEIVLVGSSIKISYVRISVAPFLNRLSLPRIIIYNHLSLFQS